MMLRRKTLRERRKRMRRRRRRDAFLFARTRRMPKAKSARKTVDEKSSLKILLVAGREGGHALMTKNEGKEHKMCQ